jgi:hypothetical protein
MQTDKQPTNQPDKNNRIDNNNQDKRVTQEAHTQADKDMEEDAEFTATSPNDDLDEAESARLGEDTPLI